ncbi:RdgB/HAM1 family non-canonical purine NTP pyrophosphatase [Lacibacterium aquatile]|uniref:RdgB/HAM1 family non-canonical purine NTP pyrophosphatase n=1 Tax=Lacibacterium aquatile TaxID=1168082 RepID=UPI003A91DBFA
MTSTRLNPGETIVLATHNKGKVPEIAALVEPFGIKVVSAGELGLPEPEETALTFTGNAELKARAAAAAANLPALADDSGLAVTALDGAPGIYSARWAGPTKDFGMAMKKVERELADAEDRSAAFVSALSLAWPDGRIVTVEGRCPGTLTFPARGANGFGYDPIFVPEGHDKTFGEMDKEAKYAISHRTLAFKQLVAKVFA